MMGALLGSYRVLEKLGEGGMGVVYVGRHETLGHPVAIKVLQQELSRNADIVKRFFNEARAAASIRHPGIVQVFDFGTCSDGAAYFVMELLEGANLGDRLRQRRFGYFECCRLARQVTNVLQAAHANGITHRDLKPDNLFLVADPEVAGGERVKVLDFGIAKLAGAAQSRGVRTESGLVLGTPTYMSPEQCRGESTVDGRADIYSLGCILFEMVCGRPPFVADSAGAIVGAQQYVEPPPPWTLAADVPRSLAVLIMRMLAKQPDARPATMAAVGQALDDVARTIGSDDGRATVAVAPLRRTTQPTTTLGSSAGMLQAVRPHRRGPLVLGGLAVGAIGALIGLAVQGGDKDAAPPARAASSRIGSSGGSAEAVAAGSSATRPARPPRAPAPPVNPWVRIEPPRPPIALGLAPRPRGDHPAGVLGFRASRKRLSPTAAYELQQHEVTWAELSPWLAARNSTIAAPSWLPSDPAQRARLPATGVPWQIASAYCTSLHGALPTEAQWELAVRGAERRPFAWGRAPLDRERTRALAGSRATPQPALASTQDRTPDGIHDLTGNVQEWTAELWTEDEPGQDESWVTEGDTTYRAVRGLPLRGAGKIPEDSAAYREPLCATGTCSPGVATILEQVGFRCARSEDGTR